MKFAYPIRSHPTGGWQLYFVLLTQRRHQGQFSLFYKLNYLIFNFKMVLRDPAMISVYLSTADSQSGTRGQPTSRRCADSPAEPHDHCWPTSYLRCWSNCGIVPSLFNKVNMQCTKWRGRAIDGFPHLFPCDVKWVLEDGPGDDFTAGRRCQRSLVTIEFPGWKRQEAQEIHGLRDNRCLVDLPHFIQVFNDRLKAFVEITGRLFNRITIHVSQNKSVEPTSRKMARTASPSEWFRALW